MKKLVVILMVLAVTAGVAAADDINLGNFPVGKWLDPNYDAVWTFSTGNIRILSPDGNVLYNFQDKTINNFKVSVENGEPVLSFSCEESRRDYRFIKPMSNMNVIMEIDAPWVQDYRVEMEKQ
ncbi:MAG: hypothetical protein K9L68_00340 [Spirochaetales bacterium]|nr:hypothetical protein [Spirochaetales bacterium]MCF7937025.1 hypothetical protein [Spirochaetales bacterium]